MRSHRSISTTIRWQARVLCIIRSLSLVHVRPIVPQTSTIRFIRFPLFRYWLRALFFIQPHLHRSSRHSVWLSCGRPTYMQMLCPRTINRKWIDTLVWLACRCHPGDGVTRVSSRRYNRRVYHRQVRNCCICTSRPVEVSHRRRLFPSTALRRGY